MDILEIANASAAWLALALTLGSMVAAWFRRRREAKQAAARHLHVETSLLGDDAMYLRVRYDAPYDHTRYAAEVQVLRPRQARLSRPRYVSRDSYSDIVVLMPSPDWDPRSEQAKMQRIDLVDASPRGVAAEMVLKGLEKGRATLRFRVNDLANDGVLVDAVRAVRA